MQSSLPSARTSPGTWITPAHSPAQRTWRVRAGDWRILYEIRDDEIMILILDVKHRSKAYGGR